MRVYNVILHLKQR